MTINKIAYLTQLNMKIIIETMILSFNLSVFTFYIISIIVFMSFDYFRYLQEDSHTEEEESEVLPAYEVNHINMMPYLWTIVINFSIFFAMYKFKAFTIYVHAIIGLFVGLTTFLTSFPILIDEGIPAEQDDDYQQRHFIIGLIVIIFLFLQLLLGITTKGLQLISWSHPYLIYYINIFHKYLGYSMMILCKIQVFLILRLDEELASTFWGLIAAEAVMIILWILCKLLFFKLQQTVVPKYQQQIQVIESLNKLDKKDRTRLAVFANYVYDIDPLLRHHPNGYRIIQSVKGMDLDRFLYGMYPSQRFPLVPPNSHSWKSLSLLDDPIAKIHIPALYLGFEGNVTDVQLSTAQLVSDKCSIYELRLYKKSGRFGFKGYTSLRQVGRYYSLTANGKTTRLYTSVAFLDPSNLDFIADQLGKENLVQPRAKSNNQIRTIPQSQRKLTQRGYISLLVKRYANGVMTPRLVKNIFDNLKLSQPRGEGLQMHDLAPGKVIIVAGGTGLYPFSDLIDLLFKEHVAKTDKTKQAYIYKHNPLLQSKPFDNFSFHLMLAVQQIEDIHPITLMQLLQLSKNATKFKLTLRLGKEPERFKSDHPQVAYVSERFDTLLTKEMHGEPYRKVWVCGPPPMCSAVLAQFDKYGVNEDKYLMV